LIYLIEKITELKLIKDKNKLELKLLFNKIKGNEIFDQYSYYLDPLQDILINEDKFSENYLNDISDKLNNIIIWYKCNNKIKSLYGYLHNANISNESKESINHTFNSIINISSDIEKIIKQKQDAKELAIETINLSSKEDIAKAYKLYKDRNITSVIKLGLKGLNKMLGERQGVPLGRSIVFAALTHNYKSTMLLNVARWCKEYNHFPIKNGKKPLIIYISLENESHENMMLWFKYVYQTILKKKLKKEPTTDEEIIQLIYDYFYQSDLDIAILRYLPSDFGYIELTDLITKYEEEGYYIPACIIDYLSQMKLVDFNEGNRYTIKGNHMLIKDLFNKTCNYLKSKGITLFTGHQLNSGASFLLNSGVYPIKKFNQSHFAGSTDVAREIDIIVYLNIEKNHKNIPYLTIHWGKTRYETSIKENDKFICYKFTEDGILDDINTKFMGVKNIYNVDDSDEDLGENQNVQLDEVY
jgi:hypothetical protein